MEVSYLHSLDYVAIAIFLALMALIGLSIGWKIKGIGAYFKGNGTIPWIMATITNFMGLFSTFIFVAYAGIAYEYGLVSITVFWVTVPACLIAGLVFGGKWRRTGHTTPIEYLEQRYGMKVRQAETWIGLVMHFLDNMVRLYAIGVFISVVTPLSLEWSIAIAGVLVTAFNFIGGIWTVTIMSTVQMVILLLVTTMMVPLSIQATGGVATLSLQMPEHLNWFNGPKGAPFWLSVYGIMTAIKYNQNWTFIQKFYCVKDEAAARKVGVVSALLFLLFTPIFLFPTVLSPLMVPEIADPEMSYVAVSQMLLPVGVMGIMFSSMFAATMSSLNSEYNVIAGVITNDVYKRLIKPDASQKQLLNVARLSTVAVGLVMIGGAIGIRNLGGAFEANKLFTGILAIPMGIPLIFGIISKRPTENSSLATIIGGIVAGVVLNLIPSLSWEMATLIEIAFCMVLYYLPVLLPRKPVPERVDALFRLVDTPIREEDKPAPDPSYTRMILIQFTVSLLVSGLMFCGLSIPSLASNGGKYGFAAGVICLVGALVMFLVYKKKSKES